jgi:predicted RNase H-like HicB family nuclease
MATTKKRNAVAPSNKPAIDRPFDSGILAEAERIAAEYQVALRFDKEDGWCGRCIELPLVVGFGRDPNSCVRETRELIATTVAVMLEMGDNLPVPASEEVRSEQSMCD